MTYRDLMAERALIAATADRTPNWNKWRLIPKPKLWQCVALSLNIDPDKVNINGASFYMSGPAGFVFNESQEFRDRDDVACANAGQDGALRPVDYDANPRLYSVSLREFAAWVQKIGWEAPAELLAMADQKAAWIDTAETGSIERRKHNKRETEARNKKWQEGIDTLAQAYPGRSHADLCRRLASETGATMSTIRRYTKLRHG